MDRRCQQFVGFLLDPPDGPQLDAALREAAALFNCPLAAYLLLSSEEDGLPHLVSNCPAEWTQHYLAQRLDRLDPVIRRARAETEAFAWGPDIGEPASGEEAVFLAAAAAFGIRYGFTVPVHDAAGRHAAFTFAAPERDLAFARAIARNGAALQLVVHYFHRHAAPRLAPVPAAGVVVLTPREYECLEWASRGKTAWETGRIIGITRRTVAFHLENAKAKLGVNGLAPAVAMLIAGRVIAASAAK